MDKRWEAIAELQKNELPVKGGAKPALAGDTLSGLAINELLKEGNWHNSRHSRNSKQIIRRAIGWAVRRLNVRESCIEKYTAPDWFIPHLEMDSKI